MWASQSLELRGDRGGSDKKKKKKPKAEKDKKGGLQRESVVVPPPTATVRRGVPARPEGESGSGSEER